MATPEALQPCVRREPQMIARLRLALTRLADAERARIWASVAAQEAGLSIRQSARATGVSPTRIPLIAPGFCVCWPGWLRTSMRSPAAPWRVLKPCQTVSRSVARHRQRPAAPEPLPRRLNRWAERAASRPALGLPPYERR
jgi:hypothetical protein